MGWGVYLGHGWVKVIQQIALGTEPGLNMYEMELRSGETGGVWTRKDNENYLDKLVFLSW